MKAIANFNQTEDYQNIKSEIKTKKYYVVKDDEAKLLHVKPKSHFTVLNGRLTLYPKKIDGTTNFGKMYTYDAIEKPIRVYDCPYGFITRWASRDVMFIILDFGNYDTSQIVDMSCMLGDYQINEILNLDMFNTSNVINMNSMFESSTVHELDLSSFDTSNVTDMCSMFNGCRNLSELDLTSFDTSNVLSMSGMFWQCENLSLINISSFDTSNVIEFSHMFTNCYKLESIDVTHFVTDNATDMESMFFGCKKLNEINLKNFNTSKVTNMNGMFGYCSGLTSIDLSNFDTSSVTDMGSMFDGCDSLTHIKCKQTFKNWCILNKDEIKLPESMQENGGGTWEIVD